MNNFTFNRTQPTQSTEFDNVKLFIDQIIDINSGDEQFNIYCKNSRNIYTLSGKVHYSNGLLMAEYISKERGYKMVYSEVFRTAYKDMQNLYNINKTGLDESCLDEYIKYCIQLIATQFKLEDRRK